MPLQYPQTSPYNPYVEPKKPANLPMIILIAFGAIIMISAIVYFIVNPFSYDSNAGNDNDSNKGIAVGEPNPSGYNCSADVYNCANFTTQSEAQYVFDYCKQQGAGDIHQLDKDGNGKACEGLA